MSKTFFWGQFVWNAINGAFWLQQKDCHNCCRKQTNLMKRNASILFPFEWNNHFSFLPLPPNNPTHLYPHSVKSISRILKHIRDPYLLLLLFYKSCSSSHFRNLQIVAPLPSFLLQLNCHFREGINTFFCKWICSWRFQN